MPNMYPPWYPDGDPSKFPIPPEFDYRNRPEYSPPEYIVPPLPRWGAIAYSLSKNEYDWSFGKLSQWEAEQAAASNLGNDSRILIWSKPDNIMAWARSGEGEGCNVIAYGGKPQAIMRYALENCRGANPKIVLAFDTKTGREYYPLYWLYRMLDWLPMVFAVLFILFILFVVIGTLLQMHGIHILPNQR